MTTSERIVTRRSEKSQNRRVTTLSLVRRRIRLPRWCRRTHPDGRAAKSTPSWGRWHRHATSVQAQIPSRGEASAYPPRRR